MFYQNSNDLVKNASNQSGHIQNSNETRQIIVNNNRVSNHQNSVSETLGAGARFGDGARSGDEAGAGVISTSLDFGSQFLNKVQGLFSLKEGNTVPENVVVANTVQTVEQNGINDLAQLKKENGIMNLIQKQDENTRNQWAEVTDTTGVSLYGYVTQNGIFQIWNIPRYSAGVSTSWLDTDKMKKNAGVIGCPKPNAFKKYKVAGKWSEYKMFDLLYDVDDTAKSNPLFMITANVRNLENSYNKNGIFSCGNEGTNVYVKERPSAVFEMTETDDSVEPGCYIFNDNVNDNELRHSGFSLQTDLTASSIAQCKRRAEDLGRSHFLLTPPNPGSLENTGRCWVYDRSGDKPNLAGVMKLDKTGNACHKLANREEGEDEIMANYSTADLPRLYGKVMRVPDPDKPLPNPECDHKTRNGCIFEDYKHLGNGMCVPQSKTKPDENAWCPFWARIGECSKNPGYMLYRCQTSCKVRDENELRKWTYDGLYTYDNDQLKGWLKGLHERNGSGVERDAVNKYINKCKGTKGYTFLDDNYVQPTKPQVAGALYSLKKGGPTGIDLGPVGKIAYIDHNGERRNYPESALSYLKPGSYVEMKGYDTRSAESSYNINEKQSIYNKSDECRKLCDANEKCGGYVYSKDAADVYGKCELKDREKMFPNGLRIINQTKQLFIKVPTINSTMKDEKCSTANQASGGGEVYKAINSAQYSFYPDGGAMTPDFKCDMKSHIPKGPGTVPVDFSIITDAVKKAEETTNEITATFNTAMTNTSPPVREGFKEGNRNVSYQDTITDVGKSLKTIANSKYQRERLLALTEESNKTLISESYKFILWSILAILTVLALLKLKEMFGQEDADDSSDNGGGEAAGGGLLATILGWFGVGSIKTDDIPDRTEEVKAALSSAGNQLKESGEQLANSVTEGANNLVKSANEAAAGAVESATNLVDKAKETASNAIDRIGTATAAAAAPAAAAPAPSGATTGGKSTRKK